MMDSVVSTLLRDTLRDLDELILSTVQTYAAMEEHNFPFLALAVARARFDQIPGANYVRVEGRNDVAIVVGTSRDGFLRQLAGLYFRFDWILTLREEGRWFPRAEGAERARLLARLGVQDR